MNERREDEQMRSQSATGETFFTRERSFYRQLFSIFTIPVVVWLAQQIW